MIVKKSDFINAAKDRTLLLVFGFLVFLSMVGIALVLLKAGYNDVQLPTRYSGFGKTAIYRDQWYMQYSYIGFILIVAIVNTLVALKLYEHRRLLSLAVLAMGCLVVLMTIIISNAVINLTPMV